MKFEKRFYPDMVAALINENGKLNIERKDGGFVIKEINPNSHTLYVTADATAGSAFVHVDNDEPKLLDNTDAVRLFVTEDYLVT